MSDMLQFTIVTPNGKTYDDAVDKVTVPTQDGAITIYPMHIPLVSVLRAGELNIHKGDSVVNLAVSSGVLEIRPNSNVIVMADTAERAEDIDVSRAEEARKRAEELLKQAEDMADVDFALLQAKIQKELARTSVANKYRNIQQKPQ